MVWIAPGFEFRRTDPQNAYVLHIEILDFQYGHNTIVTFHQVSELNAHTQITLWSVPAGSSLI